MGSTFSVASSIANAIAGTDVNTTGTDSGTGIAAAYSATTATAQGDIGISLPAGDFDCTTNLREIGVASNAPTALSVGVSTSATVMPVTASLLTATFTTGAVNNAMANGPLEFLNSGATTVFADHSVTWTGGSTSPTVDGVLRCRRAQ